MPSVLLDHFLLAISAPVIVILPANRMSRHDLYNSPVIKGQISRKGLEGHQEKINMHLRPSGT